MTKEREERLCLELELLQKARWRWHDIANYFQVASAKANQIRKKALEQGGRIDYDPHAVQSRYVLALEGTTPEIEIQKRVIELNGASQASQEQSESNQ